MFFNCLIWMTYLHSLSAFGPFCDNSSSKEFKTSLIVAVKIIICFFLIFLAASWLLFTQQGKNLKNRAIDSLAIKFGIRSKMSANKKKNKPVEIEMQEMRKDRTCLN